jgi:gluconate 2-dehydrogenase gamma chain
MAGQSMARREFMRILAVAAAASSFPGFERWSFACAGTHPGAPKVPSGTSAYRPQFFTTSEFALVDCITELIIPADEHPGAHAAGVAEFIDFMIANGFPGELSNEQLQQRFRLGLTWIDERSLSLFGKRFIDCSDQQQSDLLEHLAYRKHFRAGEEIGQAFFPLLRDFTINGYYTSRIGLEALDYPGLQTMWAGMPGCPHVNDPEHKHLPPPIV